MSYEERFKFKQNMSQFKKAQSGPLPSEQPKTPTTPEKKPTESDELIKKQTTQQSPDKKADNIGLFGGTGFLGLGKKQAIDRPDSAVTQASEGGTLKKQPTTVTAQNTEDADQDDLIEYASMFQNEGNNEANEEALHDIAAVILNQRKIKFSPNELGFANNLRGEIATIRSAMLFEINNRDSNGRAILHRAAFDQQIIQISDVLTALEEQGIAAVEREINKMDMYGNTPLMLACIRRYEEKPRRDQQHEVVKMLLERAGAHTNTQNPQTLFTPLHWACIHGANDIVKTLLKYDAKHYIPDKKGYFPIEYAGIFKHEKTVDILIKHHFVNSVEMVKKSINSALQVVPLIQVPISGQPQQAIHTTSMGGRTQQN